MGYNRQMSSIRFLVDFQDAFSEAAIYFQSSKQQLAISFLSVVLRGISEERFRAY